MVKRLIITIALCAGTVTAETNWAAAIQWNQNERLKLVREPDLIALSTNAPSDLKVLRFSYFPAFGDTIIIRMTLRGEHARARRLIYSRAAGIDQDIPADMASIEVSAKSAKSLLNRVALFFKEEQHLKIKDLDGMDGETWSLEMLMDGTYHVVSVWIPKCDKEERNTTDFVAICNQMTKLAKLSPKSDLINDTRIELCDPLEKNASEVLNRPKEPLLHRLIMWLQN